MLIEVSAGHPSLPWFRWFIFAGTLSLFLSRAVRTRHVSQGKLFYWLAAGLLAVGMLGFLWALRF